MWCTGARLMHAHSPGAPPGLWCTLLTGLPVALPPPSCATAAAAGPAGAAGAFGGYERLAGLMGDCGAWQAVPGLMGGPRVLSGWVAGTAGRGRALLPRTFRVRPLGQYVASLPDIRCVGGNALHSAVTGSHVLVAPCRVLPASQEQEQQQQVRAHHHGHGRGRMARDHVFHMLTAQAEPLCAPGHAQL